MPKITRGLHTKQTLSNVLERLKGASLSLQALISAMKHSGVDELEILGQAEMARGLKSLDNFAANGHKTLQRKLESTGAFGVGELGSDDTDADDTPSLPLSVGKIPGKMWE